MSVTAISVETITATVLADLALIVAAAALCGAVARRWGQPAVVGEIVAGLALGPSLLGLFPGDLPQLLFPLVVRPYLQVLSQVGLVLFMFGIGYQLDIGHLRGAGRRVTAISISSVALPFALGAGLVVCAPYLGLPAIATRSNTGTALFLGTAMAITAFPVLARIVAEHRMQKTWLGATALACAALQDLLAWCILAAVVAMATAAGPWPLLWMAGEMVAFGIVLFGVIRPALAWFTAPARRWADRAMMVYAVLACGLLACSWATVEMGLHAVFGAFVFGLIAPRKNIAAQVPEVPERIEQTSQLLLPVFFTVTGLSVDAYGLGGSGVLLVVMVILLACAGKFIGAVAPARVSGVDGRFAIALGVLLNARGLSELIILNVGLSLGVVDSTWFSAMVIMAVVTTMMTGPLLRRVHRDMPLQTDSDTDSDVATPVGALSGMPQPLSRLTQPAPKGG